MRKTLCFGCLVVFLMISFGGAQADGLGGPGDGGPGDRDGDGGPGDRDKPVKKNTGSDKERESRNRDNEKKTDAAKNSKFVLRAKGKDLLFLEVTDASKVLGRIELPSIPVKIVRHKNVVYAACRTNGLWVVDAANPAEPKTASVFARGEDVVGFEISGDLLVLSLATYKVRVLSVAHPSQPRILDPTHLGKTSVQAASAKEKTDVEIDITEEKTGPQRDTVVDASEIVRETDERDGATKKTQALKLSKKIEGRVIKVERREVIVDRGTSHGLSAGDRIQILSSKKMKVFDPIRKKHKVVTSNKPTAVIEVSYAAEDWARGYLGRGDRANPGDQFRTTKKDLTRSIMFPESVGGWWRIQFGLWPVIGVESRAFSLISFSSIGYQFRRSFKIEAALSPFIAIMGKPHSSASSNAILTAAYSSRFFEIGVGGGNQAVYKGRSGFVIAQTIRLGCIDGLNVRFSNQLVLSDDNREDERRFMIGSLSGAINIPLVSRVTLFLSGGGGSQFYGYGDIGIRTYLRGTGDPGTIIISSSLGIAYVESRRKVLDEDDRLVLSSSGGIGVNFSVGLDLRL